MAVTRKQAAKVFAALEKRYASDLEGVTYPGDRPQLIENWESWYSTHRWAIVWEGGPFEWAMRFTGGGFNEEAAAMASEVVGVEKTSEMAKAGKFTEEPNKFPGLFLEPINDYAIGIYPG